MTKLFAVLCVFIICQFHFTAANTNIQVPENPATVTASVDSSSSLFVKFAAPISDGGAELTTYKGTRGVMLVCLFVCLFVHFLSAKNKKEKK